MIFLLTLNRSNTIIILCQLHPLRGTQVLVRDSTGQVFKWETQCAEVLTFTETAPDWAITNTFFKFPFESYSLCDVSQCRQFLRQILPRVSDLTSAVVLQPNFLADELVITYPHGYHTGFNLGFNCVESVSFALENWLGFGWRAQACGCVGNRCVLS